MTWRIEFSSGAARSFRELPRPTQELLAERIRLLETKGIDLGPETPSAHDVGCSVRAADRALLCVTRMEEGRITIIGVDPAPDTAPAPLRRTSGSLLLRAARRWPTRFGSAGPHEPRRGERVKHRAGLGDAMRDMVADLRLAFRTFRRSPGFVLMVVFTLALGIGGNTAIFSVINNVFLSQLPFRDADRLVRLRDYRIAPSGERLRVNMASRNFFEIRDGTQSFEEVVAQDGRGYTLTDAESPTRVSAIGVSPNWASTLGVRPALGRAFRPDEELRGDDAGVALISHGLWSRSFGSDPGILGTTIGLDGRSHTVIGVLPQRFSFPYDAEVWVPATFDRNDGRGHDLNVLARLKADATMEEAAAELRAVARALEATFPTTNTGIGLGAEPARENFIGDQDQIVLALLGAVGFLLLIACVNVANMLIARFVACDREIAIRAALGAGRFRQMRQFLTETVALFLLGGASGLVFTVFLSDYLDVLVPSVLRNQLALDQIYVDARVVAFGFGLSLFAGLVFGSAAALRSSRPNLQQALKDGMRSAGSTPRRRLQRVLVVSEISLALVLLLGAGLMIENFRRLQQDDLGFQAEGLFTLRIDLGGERYRGEGEQRTNLLSAIERTVETVPGVAAVGVTTVNPICCGDWGVRIEIEGGEPPSDGASITINHRYITPGLHAAMEIPVLRGRSFSDRDDRNSPPVVIIDSRMASHFWPDEDPIGKRVRSTAPNEPWLTVVGVTEEVRDAGDYHDTWYRPYYQDPLGRSTENVHLMVQVAADPSTVLPAVHDAVWDIDPHVAIYDVTPMDDLYAQSLSQDRLGALVVGLFAAFGLLLSGFGIYGLMSYVVAQRSQEIGTRLALGATKRDVLAMVMADAVKLVAAGSVVGLAGALGLNRILGSIVVGMESATPQLMVSLTAMVVFMALGATYLPARRATQLDPVKALRSG